MFLKSIKARGFKSFARPVEFAFEPGITVVVGPNGSGKSNIVDSVLWAMGEQSPSAVRGGSMQDVIFSGSDKLAPAGMAEVELLFDNSQGILPIEFSEVLISRRLYRDGESTYFINKSPCRLIDVVEMLSDAGLGKNSHSIISQGKVEAILEGKPIERRAYIEEAAGLGKFKKRRHRAERKLEHVRRNLERLADVEEEVRSNLRPLKRQATAAERSAKLEQQIAIAETRLIKGRLEFMAAELARAEASAREASVSRAELEEKLAATAEERRCTEELLSASLKDHKQLAACFYGLKSRQESLAGKQDAVSERRQMLAAAKKRAEARRENLLGQIARVQQELKRAEEEHRSDQALLAQIDKELKARQAELEGVEEEISQRRQANAEKTRRVGELGALKDRYRHQIEYLSQRQEKLAGLIERAELESQARRRELDGLKEQLHREEERMAEWREKAGRAEAVLKEITAKRNEVDSSRQKTALELRRVEEDLKIAKARLTFISDNDRDRSGLPPAAKKVSEETGVKALVEVIDVEPGYEQALSAVMGNTLFALAAKDLAHARDMLRVAMAAEMGGVEFVLPGDISWQSGDGQSGSERRPGDDYLIDHVHIPGEWLPYVAGSLAGVRVVDDADEITAMDGICVTRDGVIYNSGRRLLSYKAELPSSMVLKYKNERHHLEQEKRRAERHYEELEGRLASLHLQFEELEKRRLEAERALSDVLQERRQAEGNATATQRQQKVLEQEIELKEASRNHLKAEEIKLEEELKEVARRLKETEVSLEEITRAASDSASGSDDTLAALRLSLSQEVTDLKITAARVRERARVDSQAIERSAPVLKRLEEELKLTNFQLFAYERLEPICSALLDKVERLMDVSSSVVNSLAVQLKEGEELADRYSATLRRLSTAEAGLQQELSQASKMSTECEVQVAKLREHVEEQSSRLAKLYERFPQVGLEKVEAAPAEGLEEAETHIERLMHRRELIGPVNPLAQQEYEEMLERQKFLAEQRADLEQSLQELTGLIKELTERIETSFAETFAAVRNHFADVVSTLFPGGEGRLTLTEPESAAADEEDDTGEVEGGTSYEDEASDPEEAVPLAAADRRGIEISVKPARKAVRSLSLLSGGERSLVAIAFLFAIFLAKPAPFYILDEVEAALDDVNITRLLNMLRRYQYKTQFIVITHQKRTMEVADVLYGVSMGADGTSKVLSRKMPQDEREVLESKEASEDRQAENKVEATALAG